MAGVPDDNGRYRLISTCIISVDSCLTKVHPEKVNLSFLFIRVGTVRCDSVPYLFFMFGKDIFAI